MVARVLITRPAFARLPLACLLLAASTLFALLAPPWALAAQQSSDAPAQPALAAVQDIPANPTLGETLTDEEMNALSDAPGTTAPTPTRVSASGSPIAFLGANFGWAGLLVAERHTPVWVALTSEKGFASGVVTLRYRQDQNQMASVSTPFSTSEGVTTLVEVPIAVPRSCDRIEIEIRDGRRSLRVAFDSTDRNAVGPMPDIVTTVNPVLLVGVPTARDQFRLTSRGRMREMPDDASSSPLLQRGLPWTSTPAQLATNWISYEGVDLVVISEDAFASADPRAKDALRAWLGAGGQVLLFASGAGDGWLSLLPEGLGRSLPITLSDQATLALPHAWEAQVQGTGVASVRDAQGRGTLPARLVRVLPSGLESGWQVLMPPIDLPGQAASPVQAPPVQAPPAQAVPSQAGLAASGPAGLGWLTVSGLQHSTFETRVLLPAQRVLWYQLMVNGPFLNIASDANTMDDAATRSWGGYSVDRQTAGQSAALEATLSVERLGPGLMLAIAGLLALLVLLVGPLGRVLVRRTVGLSRSWAFSLVAVVLATALATFLPTWVRSGKSSVGFVSVVDVLCDEAGKPTRMWTSTVIGAFAGKQTGVTLLAAGASQAPVPPGTFVRGFSPRSNDYYSQLRERNQARLGSTLALALDAPTLGNLRGHTAGSTSISQWNMLAFTLNDAGASPSSAEQASAATTPLNASSFSTPTVTLSPKSTPTPTSPGAMGVLVSVKGLAASDTIQSIGVMLPTAHGSVAATGTDTIIDLAPSAVSLTQSEFQSSSIVPAWMANELRVSLARTDPFTSRKKVAAPWGLPTHVGIGASHKRAYSLDAYVASGTHAVVVIITAPSTAPSFALSTEISASSTSPQRGTRGLRLYRMLVPLSQELRLALADALPAPTSPPTSSPTSPSASPSSSQPTEGAPR